MNRTSPGTNALRHGSCRALVCRCRRASAAVVGGTIPLHATYVTSTTPTAGDDDIPTHATVCRQRLPLASTTHSLMLQYVASAYHWRHRHTTHPCYALLHFQVDCRSLASQVPAENMQKCTHKHHFLSTSEVASTQ